MRGIIIVFKTYSNWKVSDRTLSGEGGKNRKYVHYCPFGDFKLVAYELIKIANKKGIVSKVDVIKSLEGKKLTKGSIFSKKSQEYKVAMTLQFLVDNSLIYPDGTTEARFGKKPISYKLKRSSDEIIKWIDRIV